MPPAPEFIVQEPLRNDPQLPPPYRFEDVSIQAFLCAANGANLQRLCDRFFNDIATRNGCGIRIDPLNGDGPGIVQILVQRYAKMVSLAPGYEDLGYSQQNELTFAVPVVLRRYGMPAEAGFFSPYLFVDNTLSLISGRDAVGFAKVRGEFTLPADPSDVNGCAVSTLVAKTLTRQERVQPRLLFATQADAGVSSSAGSVLPDDEAKPLWPFGPVDKIYARGEVYALDMQVLSLLRASAGRMMESYSLKQFRDAVVPADACFQAIIGASTRSRRFRVGGELPKTRITLNQYGSIAIANALGLTLNGNELEPIYGFWYRADFDFDDLRHLCISGGARTDPGRGPHDCCADLAAFAGSTLRFYEGMAHAWLRALKDFDRCD